MLAVVTGASRGLGAALMCQLIEGGHSVIAAARGGAPLSSPLLDWSSLDLGDAPAAVRWIEQALARAAKPDRACLILNAGIIEPLVPVRALDVDAVERHLRINLASPMLTTAAFLRGSEGWNVERRILGISSGAGRRGVAHWAAYCAAKAGLDGFIKALNAEETHPGGAVRAVSIAPGLVDTGMQAAIRATDIPTRQRFVDAFASGTLPGTDTVAAQLLHYLATPDFGSHELDDLREVAQRQRKD